MTPDFIIVSKLRELTAMVAAATVEARLNTLANAFKYDPGQPRVLAGSPEGGQWTSNDGSTATRELSVESILAIAPLLAAARTSKDRCIEICSPILERFQPPGTTNINYWDFVKCLKHPMAILKLNYCRR